jgi:DNA-binding CsgD family transcriptional regulator
MDRYNSVALDRQWPQELTRREREILLWVGGGMSNKEVARGFGLSVGTVKLHIHNIFQKTGARNRYELVAQMAARSAARDMRRRALP